MINKHKSNKIKENSNTVRHLNNGTDHRHSKSCCDQSSPACRTTMMDGLTHWGRVTHICVSKLTIIVPDNGLSPGRRQAIIWTNAGILLIRTLGTNFSEILSEIHIFSFKKMHLKMSSGRRRPFCLGLNVLKHCKTFTTKFVHCNSLHLHGE